MKIANKETLFYKDRATRLIFENPDFSLFELLLAFKVINYVGKRNYFASLAEYSSVYEQALIYYHYKGKTLSDDGTNAILELKKYELNFNNDSEVTECYRELLPSIYAVKARGSKNYEPDLYCKEMLNLLGLSDSLPFN